MSKFDKYVLVILVKYIVIVQIFITVLSVFVSALSHMDGLKKFGITLKQLATLEIITMPMVINSSLPITIVVSSIITVTLLMRSKELLAYVSLGGRLRRFMYPFFAIALLTTIFMVYFDHSIHASVRLKQQRFLVEVVKKRVFYDQGKLSRFWLIDHNKSLVYIGLLNPTDRSISDFTRYIISDNFSIDKVVNISSIVFDKESHKWKHYGVKVTDLTGSHPITYVDDNYTESLSILNELSSTYGKNPKEIPPTELKRTISAMKKRGLNTRQFEMLLYTKYASAFSIIVLVTLVVPMGVNFSRRYSPVKSAGVSLIFAGSFWGVMAAFSSIGSLGILPVFLANFLPHIVFLIIGGFIIRFKEAGG